jgi:putative endopeptidase
MATVIVRQPSFFTGLGEILKSFNADAWSAWLAWHLLSGASPYLSSEFVNENFAFYGTQLSGTPELKARWKRGVGLVEGSLGEAVGQIYVEKHFPPAAKTRMVELVSNLIEAYRIDIAALSWMTAETKSKAFEKLDKFTPKIGYPDKWRDYAALEITRDDLIGNLARVTKFNQDYEFAKIGAPVDRTEWLMTPQTVNAYYMPGMNEIVFPAAILQPPFFDLNADDAANYGGIGAVIGHEIGHGFDDQGSKYDGDGNLNNWWTDLDREEFEKRANKLIAQYEELRPLEAPDVHVNGALTIGENIGDLGGLTIAYKAYQLSLDGKAPPVIDGLTGYQRLFMGWAQCWRQKMRAEEVRRRVATDPHSPDEFRCNQVVRNLNEFYEAFNLSEKDALYLPESERVRIW